MPSHQMPSNSPLVSSKTSISVGLWKQTTQDQTTLCPPSVVGSWLGVYLCLLNQREEALVAGEGGKVRGFGKMVFRNLGGDNMLEKHVWWAWYNN